MTSTVESEMREMTRSRIIAKKIGLLSDEEIQSWADDQILAHAEPPIYLFSIATGDESELKFADRLDLVLDKPGDKDTALIAAEILDQLDRGRLDFDQLESIAMSCERLLDQESSCWARFSWISDELYLVREGVKDPASSHADVRSELKKMII